MPPWVPGDFLHFLEKPTTFPGFCFKFVGENGTRNQTFQPLSPGTAQLGGYMLFVNENFTRVREELAAQTSGVGGIQPSFSSIAKELGVVSLRVRFPWRLVRRGAFFFFGGGVLVEDGSKESRTPMLVRRVGNWLNLIFFGWAQLLQISYYPKRSQRWMTSSMWHVSTATFHPQNLGLGLARRQLPSGGPCPARSKESTPRVLLPCVRQRGAKGKHYTHTQVGLKLV